MIRRTTLAILAALICGVVPCEPPHTTPPQGIRAKPHGPAAFRGATIVVSPERTIENGTLIVRDGRVEAVGPGLAVPRDAIEYDLRGKVVYPGFVDPYTEYGLSHVARLNPEKKDGAPKYTGNRSGAAAWNDAIHAQIDWVERFEPDAEQAEAFWEHGVTTVQWVKFDGVFRGRGFVASLAPGLPNERVLSPRSLHFASFDKGSSEQSYPSSLMGSIALVRQTLLDAEWYGEAHQAYRRNPAQPLPEFNRGIEALSGYQGPIVFDTLDEQTLLRAARISEEMARPFVYVGSGYEYNRIEAVAAVGRPIILPLQFPERPAVASADDQLDVTLGELRHWERAPGNAAVLEEHGVTFAFTGHLRKAKPAEDEEPGAGGGGDDFLSRLRRTVRHGLSERTALAALTTVPAELSGVADRVGSLEPGMQADFFIADGDLFEETTQIHSVWIGGRRVHQTAPLDQQDFRGSYRLRLEGKQLELKLEGELMEPSGRLSLDDETVALRGLQLGRRRLTFHAALDAFGVAGAYRFELTDGGMHVLTPNGGERFPFLEPFDAEEEDPDETGDDTTLVSRRTYPSVAFGLDAPPVPETVLVRNATVWTVAEQGTLEGADLLVRDGRIEAVGRGLSVPDDARVIDATGKHVTPGIVDEHGHIAISRGVNEGSHAVTAEVRIGDVVDAEDIAIYRELGGGVTTAQLLHGSANPIGGQAQVIKLRWGRDAEALKFAAAPPTIKFALGENVKQSNWGDRYSTRYPQTRMGVETIMRDGFVAARAYEKAQRDYAAAGRSERRRMIPPRRDLQLEALVEILNAERFVHCHSYMQAEILMLMQLAESFDFRIQTFTHILEGYKVASEMAAHGATASSFSDWWAYKFEVYDAIPYNTCLLHDNGVVTSVNSDSDEMGRRLNQEAAKSVLYCGMDETEALKLVTLNPAIQLKIDDRVGSLAAGKDADFVIWNAHPLSMYARAEQTWIDGAAYFTLERDLELRREVAREKQALVQKALVAEDTGGGGASNGRQEPQWSCEDVDDVWRP